MLHCTILDNGSATSLIDENGRFYSFSSLMENVFSYVRLIRFLKLNEPDKVIGIYFKDSFSTITAFLACTLEPVNFTLLSTTDTKEQTLVKINHAGVTVLFSDITSSINVLTINNDFLVLKEGVEINNYSSEQRKVFNFICAEMLQLKELKVAQEDLVQVLSRLSNTYTLSKERHFIGFHLGITTLFKASVFQIDAIHIGISNAIKQLYTEEQGKILYLEPLELLYDLISGVLAPILSGKTVILGKLPGNNSMYSPTAIYINSSTYTNIFEYLENSYARTNNSIVKLLNNLNLNIIRWFRLRNQFNKIFGKAVQTVYITGKLGKTDYSVWNKVSIVNLYCIAEVASFISYKRFKKYTPNKSLSVGEVGDNVSIMDGTLGELFVFTKDSCVSYLQQDQINYSFIHGYPGKIRTGDAGYIKDNELYVLGKAKFTFIKNNTLVDTDKIINLVKRESFVKHCAILKHKTKLIVIFDLRTDYLLSNSTLTYEKLVQKSIELKTLINNSVNEHSKVDKVILYPDPEGMKEINNKLVSRSF